MKAPDLNETLQTGGADALLAAIEAMPSVVVPANKPVKLPKAAGKAEEKPKDAKPEVSSGASWDPIDLRTVDTSTPLRPGILHRVDGVGLLYPGLTHSIAGEPGGGKSWFALCAAAATLQAGHRVVYIDAESGPKTIKSRLVALGCGMGHLDPALMTYIAPNEKLWANKLEAALSPAPTLVVIDGVTASFAMEGLDPIKDVEVARWYHMLPNVCAASGAAVLTIDHVVKNRENRGGWATGSGAKKALLTGVFYQLDVVDPFGIGRTGRLTITLAGKDREGVVQGKAGPDGKSIGTLVLQSHGETGPVLWRIEVATERDQARADKEAKKRRDQRLVTERVWTFIDEHPGCSTREVRGAKLGGSEAVGAAIDTMEREGSITRDNQGQSKACWRTLFPLSDVA